MRASLSRFNSGPSDGQVLDGMRMVSSLFRTQVRVNALGSSTLPPSALRRRLVAVCAVAETFRKDTMSKHRKGGNVNRDEVKVEKVKVLMNGKLRLMLKSEWEEILAAKA